MTDHNKPNYSTENPSEMVDSLNTVLDNGLLLNANMNGQIIENIKLPVGVEVKIPHNLKSTPKYRIILRQTGGLLIVDGSEWNDKYITLKGLAVVSSGSFTPAQFTNSMYVNTSGSGATLSTSYLNSIFSGGSFSGGSSDAEATVTIILMRG